LPGEQPGQTKKAVTDPVCPPPTTVNQAPLAEILQIHVRPPSEIRRNFDHIRVINEPFGAKVRVCHGHPQTTQQRFHFIQIIHFYSKHLRQARLHPDARAIYFRATQPIACGWADSLS
jgi:hypothetical protein